MVIYFFAMPMWNSCHCNCPTSPGCSFHCSTPGSWFILPATKSPKLGTICSRFSVDVLRENQFAMVLPSFCYDVAMVILFCFICFLCFHNMSTHWFCCVVNFSMALSFFLGFVLLRPMAIKIGPALGGQPKTEMFRFSFLSVCLE